MVISERVQTLAPQNFETKFAKLNVEKAKFFVDKLKIRVLPAVICFENGVVVDRFPVSLQLLLMLHGLTPYRPTPQIITLWHTDLTTAATPTPEATTPTGR